MTEFGILHPDGTYEKTREIPQEAMRACPHFIMVPEHYDPNNSCRCTDETHTEMKEWGYYWDRTLRMWV